jgi:hypothetical protein
VSLNQINASQGRQGGKGMAIAGIAIGAVTTLFGVFLLLSPDFWYAFDEAYYGY